MILSRRRYQWGDASLEQQRALSPTWILRRCDFGEILEDERPLSVLGRDIETGRARLTVVLRGRTAAFVRGQSWELAAGDAIVAAPLGDLFNADVRPSTGFELDWDVDDARPFAVKLRLSSGLLAAARAVSEALRVEDARTIAVHAAALFARVAAEGLPAPDASALVTSDPTNQAAMNAVDAILNELREHPQLIDLEASLGCSRWTLTRRLHALHKTYALSGLGGATDWRSMRDFARLRVAGLLMSNPRATTRGIAEYVGYRSPEAMCHAFANAGLPSPGRFHERPSL
jgi:AraC-like DNA-binding protein